MIIDGNPIEKKAMELYKEGKDEEASKIQDEFLKEFREEFKLKDHCSCTSPCKIHGNCIECVAVHRAHGDHLPNCFKEMVSERIQPLADLIESTLIEK